MDYSAAKFWFDIIQTALIFIVGLHNWLSSRQAATDLALRKLEHKIEAMLHDHSERLVRVEQDAEHAPSHDDFKRVHQRLDGVNGELNKLTGEFIGVKNTLSLIHQVMIERNKP